MKPLRDQSSIRKNVLIVEDDPLVAQATAMMIESELQCDVLLAPSIAKALELIDDRVGLALLDVEVADGLTYQLALQMQRRGIPVVFVSGSDPADVPSELAATPFFRKPVYPTDLVTAAIPFIC